MPQYQAPCTRPTQTSHNQSFYVGYIYVWEKVNVCQIKERRNALYTRLATHAANSEELGERGGRERESLVDSVKLGRQYPAVCLRLARPCLVWLPSAYSRCKRQTSCVTLIKCRIWFVLEVEPPLQRTCLASLPDKHGGIGASNNASLYLSHLRAYMTTWLTTWCPHRVACGQRIILTAGPPHFTRGVYTRSSRVHWKNIQGGVYWVTPLSAPPGGVMVRPIHEQQERLNTSNIIWRWA